MELNDLIAMCKKNGIKRIKHGDIELEFSSHDLETTTATEFFKPGKMPGDDELLYWSSGYSPTEEREEAQAKEGISQ